KESGGRRHLVLSTGPCARCCCPELRSRSRVRRPAPSECESRAAAPVCADLLQPGCSGPGNRPAPQSSRPGAVLRSSREYPVPDGARWQWQSLLQSTGRQTRKTEPGSAPSFFVSVCRLFKVGFGQFCCEFLADIN